MEVSLLSGIENFLGLHLCCGEQMENKFFVVITLVYFECEVTAWSLFGLWMYTLPIWPTTITDNIVSIFVIRIKRRKKNKKLIRRRRTYRRNIPSNIPFKIHGLYGTTRTIKQSNGVTIYEKYLVSTQLKTSGGK